MDDKGVYVYVIAYHDDGPVKIGIAADPEKRLAQLQIGNPYKLTLYLADDYARRSHAAQAESLIHRCLKSKHLSGEWFQVGAKEAVNTALAGHLHWIADTY